MLVATIAVVSGLLQALGYTIYIWKSLRNEVNPNPTTWLMFAYGTASLTILEWDRNASWELLVLPITCATMSVFVAFLCWSRGTLRWPHDRESRIALTIDVCLTIGYICAWVASSNDLISTSERQAYALTFLLLSNMSTAVSFLPLAKETWDTPTVEHPLPWAVWALAYGSLGVVTVLDPEMQPEFLIYPVSCVILHGLVAILALRGKSHLEHAHRALDG